MSTIAERIFVPAIAPPDRHGLIFSTFDALPAGAAFEIINDHDPAPLRDRFDRLRAGLFSWQYLACGPTEWQVRISRVQTESGDCGDACGCSGA